MSRNILRIGITAGDVNGIGPEVALKAIHQKGWPENHRLILIGHYDVLQQQARKLGLACPPRWNPEDGMPRAKAVVWEPEPGTGLKWHPGKVRVDASRAAASWIGTAVTACRQGLLDAMVTAPICKEGFHRAGIKVPGHTELLAGLTDTSSFAMMLFGGPLRVVLATRHIPLAEVPRRITRELVREVTTLTVEGLGWMGQRRRRVAVCGLNPHAGEGGALGTEDRDVIAPAVRDLRRRGLDVHGPLPGDTVFHQAANGEYDAVVAMYHDQGLAPLKLVAFESGVNLTLGLPIVRTSPDHGTAFALAGKNRANPSSMVEAIRQAGRLARRCNPWADA